MREDTGVSGRKIISPPSSDNILQRPKWSAQIHFLINARTGLLGWKKSVLPDWDINQRSVAFLGTTNEAEEYGLFDDILVPDFRQKVICKMGLSYRTCR